MLRVDEFNEILHEVASVFAVPTSELLSLKPYLDVFIKRLSKFALPSEIIRYLAIKGKEVTEKDIEEITQDESIKDIHPNVPHGKAMGLKKVKRCLELLLRVDPSDRSPFMKLDDSDKKDRGVLADIIEQVGTEFDNRDDLIICLNGQYILADIAHYKDFGEVHVSIMVPEYFKQNRGERVISKYFSEKAVPVLLDAGWKHYQIAKAFGMSKSWSEYVIRKQRNKK